MEIPLKRGIGNDCRHIYDRDGHLVATTIRAQDGTAIVEAINENAALRAEVTRLSAIEDKLGLAAIALQDERDEMKYRLQVHADLIGETEHGLRSLRKQLAQCREALIQCLDLIIHLDPLIEREDGTHSLYYGDKYFDLRKAQQALKETP